MKSLVLGGNGFIGTHLVDVLLEDGHRVRIYDRSLNGFRANPKGAEYVRGELDDLGLVREALEDIEVVFHFVNTTIPKTSNDDPVYDVSSNLVGTLRVLESCVQAGVRKVVFASSGGTVYGQPRTVPIAEGHPTEPITSYGIVKLAVEKYLALFEHLHGLDYAALRSSNLYGPYQDPGGQQGVIPVFLSRLRAGQPVTIWGDGSVVRDYLYISDLVEALKLAARANLGRKVLNVGSGRGTSLNELIAIIARVTGSRPEVRYVAGRSLDVPANVLDVARVREELGWKPQTGLDEGIDRTWDWIRTLAQEAAGREAERG